MKTTATLFCIFICALALNAQTAFIKTYGGAYPALHFAMARQDANGRFIALGTASNSSGVDIYSLLVKTDQNGDTLWTRKLDNGAFVGLTAIQTTMDGGYVLCGGVRTSSVADLNVLVMKLDSNGNQLWANDYGGTMDEVANSIQEQPSGGFIVAGYTESFGAGAKDVFLIDLSASGSVVWTKCIGGLASDLAFSVKPTSDGGFILAGTTESYGNAGGYSDIYLVKTDASGSPAWSRTFGGTYNDTAYSVIQTSDGGYMVAGCLREDQNDYSWYFIKTDNAGMVQWQKSESAVWWGTAHDIVQTADGGYIASGYWGSGVIFTTVLKMDNLGTPQWGKQFNAALYRDNTTTSVVSTSDGGYLVANGCANGQGNVQLTKIDAGIFSSCVRDTLISMIIPVVNSSSPNSLSGPAILNVTFDSTVISQGLTVFNDCDATTIREQKEESGISVYPDPSMGLVTISCDGKQLSDINVFDLQGNLIRSVNNENQDKELKVDLSGLPNGIYILRGHQEENVVYRRIVISR